MKFKKNLLIFIMLFLHSEIKGLNYNSIINESLNYCAEKNEINYQRILEFGNVEITPEELLLKCAKSRTEKLIFEQNFAGRSQEYIYFSIQSKTEKLIESLENEILKNVHSQEEQAKLRQQLTCFRFQNFILIFHHHLKIKNSNFFSEKNYTNSLIKNYTYLINGCGKSYF